MIQLPENVRQYVTAVARHHFWILAALVPLAMLPTLVIARRSLDAEMDAARDQIATRFKSLRSVQEKNPEHPNEKWAAGIEAQTARVKRETLAEWRRFWEGQEQLRRWPKALGDDFVQRAAALRAGGRLPRKMLERYQNGVRAVVRGLPDRMGAEERMLPDDPADQPAFGGRPAARASGKKFVRWDPEDQRRVYASFNWDKPPSTLQVVLAQEEVGVYGLLSDRIAAVNKGAAGAYDAAITEVEQLAIGYPAAEELPGNSAAGRIMKPPAAAGAPGFDPLGGPAPAGVDPASLVPAPRPHHPRFAGYPGAAAAAATPDVAGMPGMPGDPSAPNPDDDLRNWIYVSFAGRPFTAAELAGSPEAQMVHLMPFVIRIVMDQRKLDAWLVELATSPVPIDVRQVRINTGPAPAAAPNAASQPPARRPYDIQVELRGTVGLATPPQEAVVGLEAEASPADPAADPAANAPPGGDQETPPPTAAPATEVPRAESVVPTPGDTADPTAPPATVEASGKEAVP
ncbi:MAG: hypothetical protein EBZ59_07855 [Planctomycetia bacterium]|nr:hypothetical protein [Planctomycetia bacterium]